MFEGIVQFHDEVNGCNVNCASYSCIEVATETVMNHSRQLKLGTTVINVWKNLLFLEEPPSR